MQTASLRIWARVSESISYDNNRFTASAFPGVSGYYDKRVNDKAKTEMNYK